MELFRPVYYGTHEAEPWRTFLPGWQMLLPEAGRVSRWMCAQVVFREASPVNP